MNPRIIYPIPERQSSFYRTLRNIVRIVFLCASAVCLLVNLLVKGKMWSLIVIWSLFSIWKLVFSLRMVEFSIFSHTIRISFYLAVLLLLIDHFLARGWAQTVIPIVLFTFLLLMIIIFYVTYDRKARHLSSIMLLGLLCLASIPYSIHSWPITNWVAFAFSTASFVLFLMMIIINWKDILYELKVRLNTKQS